VPPGYTAEQRNQPGGFAGDPDIFDTWATSSLTPQIAAQWAGADDLMARVFPYDVRPQAHDIIRTWLFSTVVRAHHEHGSVPWTHAALSGWILDPDRKKMSKSKGNTVTPIGLFDQYGTDAVRYWAASARPGTDTAFSEEQMKVGRKLATKLLNVSKFVLGLGTADELGVSTGVTEPVDAVMLARLDATISEATKAFDAFDYARALERTEAFFWWFCDNYVELVKGRAYATRGADEAASARVALRTALSAIQRLFAPFLPFASEETWSWWQAGSVHTASWPVPGGASSQPADALDPAVEVLAQVRRAKTAAKASQRAEVANLHVYAPAELHAPLDLARADLIDAGSIRELVVSPGDELRCDVVLAG